MPDYRPDTEASAYAELDQLTADYREAETHLEKAREALREGIVRHLRERSAPPGKIAEHTPYDRNHVGRIAREADVPPIRSAQPKPGRTRKRA